MKKLADGFGDRLTLALKNKEKSEPWLAEQLGVKQQSVNNWTRGIHGSKKMHEVAAILDVSVDWLVYDEGPMHIEQDKYDGMISDLVATFKGKQKKAAFKLLQTVQDIYDDTEEDNLAGEN